MSDDRRWNDRDRRGGWDFDERGREGRSFGGRQDEDRGRSFGGRQGGGSGGAAFGGRDWDDRGWGDFGRGEDFGRRGDDNSARDLRPRDQERGWGGADRDQWIASRGGAFGGQSERDRLGADEWRGYTGSQAYGRGSGYGGGPSLDRSGLYGRESRAGDADRDSQGDRSWINKAGDEVSSWFGDRDAERRRREDQARGGDHRGRGPSGYRRSDERIREDVNDRLSDDAWLDASGIEVQVQGGEVTLTGTVHDRNDKRHAEDLAERISGVTHVQNNLRVKTASGVLQPASPARDMTGTPIPAGTAQNATSVGTAHGSTSSGAHTGIGATADRSKETL